MLWVRACLLRSVARAVLLGGAHMGARWWLLVRLARWPRSAGARLFASLSAWSVTLQRGANVWRCSGWAEGGGGGGARGLRGPCKGLGGASPQDFGVFPRRRASHQEGIGARALGRAKASPQAVGLALSGVGLGWVKASPGRLPTVRAAFPAGPDWAAVPGCPVTRPTGLLTAPRPRGGARGREMPPCLCVCALVCLRGGGGLWHTCLLHCCSALAHMARGSVCLVLQAPAGRLESLTLSPPGEMWAWARNLHVTRTCYPTTPRLPIGTGRRWYVARLG